MRRIMRLREGVVVSTLEPIVVLAAQGCLKRFARDILQAATATTVDARPAQGFPIAAAVTHAQPAVLPKLAGRAEALRRMNVSAEPASTDWAYPGSRADDADLRQCLRRAQQ